MEIEGNTPTAVEDTGAPDSAPEQNTQANTAPETGETAAPSAPDTGDSAVAAGLKTPQQDQPTTPQAEPEADWQDRYKHLQAYNDRQRTQAMQRIQALQAENQQYQTRMKEWEAKQKAQPWEPTHPEHRKFGGLLERAKAIHKQLQATSNLPPEQAAAAKQAIMAAISPEEQQSLEQYRGAVEDFQRSFFENPKEALAPVISEIVKTQIEQVQAEYAGKAQVETDWEQPHIKPLIENPQYAGYLKTQLDGGVPYPQAMEMMKLRAVVDILHGKLNSASRTEVHAQEQIRLAKGKAARSAVADPATAAPDPYRMALKEAKDKGIAPGSHQFNKLIAKYTSNQ